MERDDTWELLDEPTGGQAAPQIGKRLTRRQKLLRAAGASMAVLVALTVIASQFGYLDFTRDLWNDVRLAQTSTLTHTTLVAHPMGKIQAGPWEKIPLPVSADLFGDMAVAPTTPATAYVCSVATPPGEVGVSPVGGLLFWSTQDAGQHWLTLPLIGVLGDSCALSIAPDDPGTVIAVAYRDPLCTASSVYLTHDGGAHWHQGGMLPSTPANLKYCALWVEGTARHLLVQQWYERNDVKQDDPKREGSAMYHSEDGGQTWRSATLLDPQMPIPVLLADGATLLTTEIRQESPTKGYTTLWASPDAGESWDALAKLNSGFEATRLLVASGTRKSTPSLASPFYLLADTAFSLGLRVQIAQVTDRQHWAMLPPLPIAGATVAHMGITQALAVTPSGKLLVLGLGPDDRIPQDGQYDRTLFARQWLWEWDPRLTRWSVVTTALDVPWSQCSDGCWSAFIAMDGTLNGATDDLWLRSWDLSGTPTIAHIRLPD